MANTIPYLQKVNPMVFEQCFGDLSDDDKERMKVTLDKVCRCLNWL